jgi:hypothetical protein
MTAIALPRRRGLREIVDGLVHMAVIHITALRSVLADAVDNWIKTTGSANADGTLRLRESTTTVVDFPFTAGFGAASSGIITNEDVPIEVTAAAAGVVDNAQILDRDEALVISCSVTPTGGGGDIEVTNDNIAENQDCSLESLTYEAAP